MTDTTPRATRADIEAILRSRREVELEPVEITSRAERESNTTEAPGAPSAKIGAQSLSLPAPPATDPREAELADALEKELPELEEKAVALATGEFRWSEVTALIAAASEAVAVALPLVKGLDAQALTQAIVVFLLRRYVVPRVPAANFVIPFVPFLIGFVYRLVVKPKLAGETPAPAALAALTVGLPALPTAV